MATLVNNHGSPQQASADLSAGSTAMDGNVEATQDIVLSDGTLEMSEDSPEKKKTPKRHSSTPRSTTSAKRTPSTTSATRSLRTTAKPPALLKHGPPGRARSAGRLLHGSREASPALPAPPPVHHPSFSLKNQATKGGCKHWSSTRSRTTAS